MKTLLMLAVLFGAFNIHMSAVAQDDVDSISIDETEEMPSSTATPTTYDDSSEEGMPMEDSSSEGDYEVIE